LFNKLNEVFNKMVGMSINVFVNFF
jgi:hypothetical protein